MRLLSGGGAQVPLRLALVSSRIIRRGEELLYDYCGGFRHDDDSDAPHRTHRLVRCVCGQPTCRRWVF